MNLGKLQNASWYLRLTIFAVVAGVLYTAFWYFITRNTRNETGEMQNEIAQLLPKNAQAQIASQRLNEFKAIYKSREEEYDELKALLPEQRELTMVLQGVQDRVHTAGLTLTKFNPKEDVQQDNYSGKKIEVTVTSSFASLRNFFEQIAHYQRIVSITNFDLQQLDKQSPSKTVNAKFDLTAYYASAEKIQNANSAKPVAGGQAPVAPSK